MTEQQAFRQSTPVEGGPEQQISPRLLGSPFNKKNRLALPMQFPPELDSKSGAQRDGLISRIGNTPNSRGSLQSTPHTPISALSSPRVRSDGYQGTPAPTRPSYSLDGKSSLNTRSSNRHSMIEFSVQSSPEPSIRPVSRSESLRNKLSLHRKRLSSASNSPKDARGHYRTIDIRHISAPTQVADSNIDISERPAVLGASSDHEKRNHRNSISKLGKSMHIPGLGLGFGQNTIPEPRIPARRRINRNSITDAASLLDLQGSHSPFRLDELHRRVIELEYEANVNRADLEVLLAQEAEIAELRDELNRARTSQLLGDRQTDLAKEDRDEPASLKSHNSTSSYETAGGTCSTRPSWPGSADAETEGKKSWYNEVKQIQDDQPELDSPEGTPGPDFSAHVKRLVSKNELTGSVKLSSAPPSVSASPQPVDFARLKTHHIKAYSKNNTKDDKQGQSSGPPPCPDLNSLPGLFQSHMRSLSYAGSSATETSPGGVSRLSDSLLHPGLSKEENKRMSTPVSAGPRSPFSSLSLSDTFSTIDTAPALQDVPENLDLEDESSEALIDMVKSLRQRLAVETKRADSSEYNQQFMTEQLTAAKNQIDSMRASRDTLRRQIAAYQNSLNTLEEDLKKEKLENKRIYQDLITRETELNDLKLSFEERLLDDFRAADAALTLSHI